MHVLSSLVLVAAAALLGRVSALPLVVTPGTAQDLVITAQDTINGTAHHSRNSTRHKLETSAATANLALSFVNNLNGSFVNAYVTGLDSNNQLVLLQPDGTWYYPVAENAVTPQLIETPIAISLGGQGTVTNISLPDYISSGRIWFAEGTLQFFVVQTGNGLSLVEPSAVNPSDPNAAVNWGFVELTNTEEGGLFANISYVDFVGLILGMIMQATDGTVQSAPGLQANSVVEICNDLNSQASVDGQPWNQLCMTTGDGTFLRAIAPNDYISLFPDAFSSYWTDYVNEVWATYSNEPLTIATQTAAGNVSCMVTNGMLNCEDDNRGYAQPVAADIFGCNSGPFAIEASDNQVHQAVVPRLCAAFDRSTLLLEGGNIQPGLDSSFYFTTSPTNYYTKTIHTYEVDGTGYAFSYDDVTPDGDTNESGVIATANPELLTVIIGGPLSVTIY